MDRDRLRRVGRAQAQLAATVRMQIAGVQRVAIAGQAMVAVVVEQRGNKMKLQVAACVLGQPAAHEATGFGDIGTARPVAMPQPAQAGGQFIEVVVSDLLCAAVQGADVQMILQVAADLGQVGDHRDAVFAQVIGWPESGQHQQLRRVDRAAGDDHLAGVDALGVMPAAAQLHADRAAAIEQHAFDQGVRVYLQIPALAYRFQIGHCSRAARAVALGDLVQAEAGLPWAVEIVAAIKARAGSGVNKRRRQHVVMAQIGHAEWTADPVQCAGATTVVFAAQEPRQHLLPRPAQVTAGFGPTVVVGRHPTDVAHGVDRTGTAQGLAARPPQPALVERGFRFGAVVPVDPAIVGQSGDAGGHVQQRIPIACASFQQQHAFRGIRAESVGQYTSGRAGTDDHVVVAVQGRSPLGV